MRKFLLHIILLLTIASYAQEEMSFEEMEKYYDLMEDFYGQKNYSLDVTYQSFKGHRSTVPEDQMKGYVVKRNDEMESLQLGIYSIQNKEVKLLIDSTEKYVGITYPDSNSAQGFTKESFDESKMRMEKMLLDFEGRDAVIQFIFKQGYQYEKVVMKISPKGLVKEMTLYFSSALEYETQDGEKAKEKAKVIIRSSVSNRKISNKIDAILTREGGKYLLTESYKAYELMDFRYQTN